MGTSQGTWLYTMLCVGSRVAVFSSPLLGPVFPLEYDAVSISALRVHHLPPSLKASAAGGGSCRDNCRPESRGGRRRVRRDCNGVGFVLYTAGANRSHK